MQLAVIFKKNSTKFQLRRSRTISFSATATSTGEFLPLEKYAQKSIDFHR
jgi:hypothetical protein